MSRLGFLALLVAYSVSAAATEIESYTLRLRSEANGSGRAQATVVVRDCRPGILALPLGFASQEDLRLDQAPAGVHLEPGFPDGMTLLRFHLPEGTPAVATLVFSFGVKQVFQKAQLQPGEKATLPAGSRLFRHAFVNTQETPIGLYRLEFLGPEDTRIQAIREQLPKPRKQEVGPRVLLTKLDGRQAATLQFSDLHQGDDTSMLLEVVPARRSFVWLIAGLLIGALYLFKFRDLVTEPPASPAI